jgi:hypothetical protein
LNKKMRRIEIIHYRRVIVSQGLSAAGDPFAGRTAGLDLEQLTEVPGAEALDDVALTGGEVRDERLRDRSSNRRIEFDSPRSLNSK